MFKSVYMILGCISMLHLLFTDASALEITSPTEGQTVEIGSTLHVVVKPQPGEKFTEVIAGLETIPYDASLNAFVLDYPIPQKALPGEATFNVEGLSVTGEIIASSPRKYKLVFPAGVVLTAIKIPDDQKILYFSRIGQILHLYVQGVYSDDVVRRIDKAGGTSFGSSNVSVATVTATGDVSSIANGTAEITISSSGKQVKVPVVVKLKP